MPVISAPPTYSPSRETTSKVVAVPKSTHTAEPAEALADRDRVDEPVGADLARVVVADRHAGLRARPDGEHLVAEVARGHRGPLGLQLRNGRGDDRASQVREGVSAQLRAGCAAPRRARRRWTGARSQSASARAAARRGRRRSGSACCRRRRRAASASIMLGDADGDDRRQAVPLPGSHPCAAVDAALELKSIAYQRVDLLPMTPDARRPAALRRPDRAGHAHRRRAARRLARDHAPPR